MSDYNEGYEPIVPAYGKKKNVVFNNSYSAAYGSQDGDVSIQIVAANIIEAAKIACMPGMMAQESVEPVAIRYLKSKVGTAAPVRVVSFDTIIEPRDAQLAGAVATPLHFDVDNGTKVIFTASEPFGFSFEGWYRDGGQTPISTQRVAEIEVYDPHKSNLKFYAKYAANPSFRSGRYIDIQASNNSARASIWDFDFDPIASYQGRVVLNADDVTAYYGAIQRIDTVAKTITIVPDATLGASPTEFTMTLGYAFSPIGLTLNVTAVSLDNVFGYETGALLQLKYLY